jgi:hypothetical protein
MLARLTKSEGIHILQNMLAWMRRNSIMETIHVCTECGTAWQDEKTCQDHFHQMLFWEWEIPDYRGEVHHLVVLCYHLQHPSLYSPEGLNAAMHLLADFLERSVMTEEVRRRNRTTVDSRTRVWKIKGTSTSHGAYGPSIQWTITAANVIAGGVDNFCDSVRTWARSVLEDLKASGNFSPQ